jgi:nucleoside-diphosphate-sugar epimerase
MTTTIVVAGASGDLGGRIIRELLARGANVTALVRAGASADKLAKLADPRVGITVVDWSSVADLARVCAGAACVVSALQGLRDVIVDVQSRLLDGAIAARVPRFIPSDYSIDFMKLPVGSNRNLDLRRDFHARLDSSAIVGTSILNGAFAELLTGRMPLLDYDAKRATYWESADQLLDFTTMDNTAAFTAAAALDPATPKTLRIAGDSISTRELAIVAGELHDQPPFELVCAGSLDELAGHIQRFRSQDPASEAQAFPRWQGMQYMRDMFSGAAKLEPLDNARYPDIKWTNARDVIAAR